MRSGTQLWLGRAALAAATAYPIGVVASGRLDLSLDAALLGRPGLGLTFGSWIGLQLVVLGVRTGAWRRLLSALRARPDRIALAGIVALALVLRMVGLESGQRLEFGVDEQRYIAEAGRMLAENTLDHRNLEHGGLPYYVQALASFVYGVVGPIQGLGGSIADLPEEGFLRYGRYAMAVLGGLNVLALAWAVAPLRAGWMTPLGAALLLALDADHIGNGRFVHDDMHAAFFVTLTWGAMLRLPSSKSPRADVYAGLLAGLATAAKYYDLVLVMPLVAALLLDPAPGKGTASVRVARALAAMALGFFLGSPYTILHPGEFLAQTRDLHLNTFTAEKGLALAPLLRNSVLDGLGPVFAGVLVSALVVRGATARASALVNASFPLTLLVLFGNFHRLYPRYLLPLHPFLCVAVVTALDDVVRWGRARGAGRAARVVEGTVAAVALVGLACQVPGVVEELRNRSKGSSVAQAESWALSFIPRGSRVLSEVRFLGDPAPDRFEIDFVARVSSSTGSQPDLSSFDYVIISQDNFGRPGARPRYAQLVRSLALVKVFDGIGGSEPDAADPSRKSRETRIYATRRFPTELAAERTPEALRARAGVLPPGSYTVVVTLAAAAAPQLQIEVMRGDDGQSAVTPWLALEGDPPRLRHTFQLDRLEAVELAIRARDAAVPVADVVLERAPDPEDPAFSPRKRERGPGSSSDRERSSRQASLAGSNPHARTVAALPGE